MPMERHDEHDAPTPIPGAGPTVAEVLVPTGLDQTYSYTVPALSLIHI